MATFSERLLSGSTSGRGIKVVATATSGTLIHTAVAGANDIDEIYLYAVNTSSADVNLTLEWGGVTVPDDNIFITVPAYKGLVFIVPGMPLNGGLIVRAFASVASVIVITGYVQRITA